MDNDRIGERLDVELSKRGLVKSRTTAKALILENKVLVNGTICNVPNKKISADDEIVVTEKQKYVGRGGYKLEGALKYFNLKVDGLVCLDVGSSTGGFTDCLLQNGAAHVTAVDVGSGQFDQGLLEKNKDKISLYEDTDIREYTKKGTVETAFDVLVCDVSFISVRLLAKSFYKLLKFNGVGIILVKPQFEVGKGNTKKGIVREESLREEALADVVSEFKDCKFKIMGTCDSPIQGSDGNHEYFLRVQK